MEGRSAWLDGLLDEPRPGAPRMISDAQVEAVITQTLGSKPAHATHFAQQTRNRMLHFAERNYAGGPTNWWIPNRACAEATLRSAGFELVSHREEEVYICRCKPIEERLPALNVVSQK